MPSDKAQEAAYRSADLNVMQTGLFSDCVVTCGPKTWNLHRVTLCARSIWFEKALTSQFKEGIEAAVNIREQDPEAVEICLKYIYAGVAGINLEQELVTRNQQPFKFCAELYRSADFFMLKPLCTFVQGKLGNYLDEAIKWLYTFGYVFDDYYKEQNARVWINDLKSAILEAEKWKNPVITKMFKEFIWASRGLTAREDPLPAAAPHVDLLEWLTDNVPDFMKEMSDLCTFPRWPTECGRLFWDDEEKVLDPFNLWGLSITRAWCEECVEDMKYPWRHDGYL